MTLFFLRASLPPPEFSKPCVLLLYPVRHRFLSSCFPLFFPSEGFESHSLVPLLLAVGLGSVFRLLFLLFGSFFCVVPTPRSGTFFSFPLCDLTPAPTSTLFYPLDALSETASTFLGPPVFLFAPRTPAFFSYKPEFPSKSLFPGSSPRNPPPLSWSPCFFVPFLVLLPPQLSTSVPL